MIKTIEAKMDYVQIITTIGTAVSTIFIIKSGIDKKFDELKIEIRSQKQEINQVSDRIAKIEGEMETIRSMLHALIGSLISHKTGTDGK